MKSDINKNTRLQRTFNKYFKLNDTDLCILDCYGCSISKKRKLDGIRVGKKRPTVQDCLDT